MKRKSTLLALLLIGAIFTGCKKDDPLPPANAEPTIDNLEIGLNNNEMAIIGKDFHFNADVLVSGKIQTVEVRILPRTGETYAKPWSMEVVWDQYKDAKNATVHKHFDIPTTAAEGKYDFIITVNDQNGSKLELKKSISIYAEANVPVNPSLSIFNIFNNDQRFYRNGKFSTEGAILKKGDVISSQVTIGGLKGDGKMYLLLINKKANHRPESIDKIDFSKVIVYDVYEHKGWANTDFFSNSVVDLSTNTVIRNMPSLTIGSAIDNNLPQGNPINNTKAWESGTYYYGVVYQNSTYKMGLFHYIEIPVTIN